MPSLEPMAEPLSDAAHSATGERAAQARRRRIARKPDAEPAIRELIEALLATRIEELHEAGASLEREVQERRMVELALRESETRLRDLARNTADWIWEVDANARYTSCSDRVKDVLGYAPEEIIGRTPFDLMVEEDAAAIAPVFERLARCGPVLLRAQEPQPAQGRPRGHAAHELRPDAQRRR